MNREIYPATLYPLTGDVQSQPGSPGVTVTGIQGVPVSSATLSGGEVMVYNQNAGMWQPTLKQGIRVNGIGVSDDYGITVNVLKMVKINGA